MAFGDLKATLQYHVKDNIRPYYYGYRREGIEEGVLDANGTTMKKVTHAFVLTSIPLLYWM